MTLEFAAAGADVAINWLDDNGAVQRVAEEVRAYGRRAILVNADVGQIDQVHAMVSATEEELGPIDILINNAGVFPARSLPRDDGARLGPCLGCQPERLVLLRAGRRKGDDSRRAARGDHQHGLGCGAPWFTTGRALRGEQGRLLSLTRAMTLELAPYRFRVNAIAPRLTDTAQPRYGSSEAEIVEMARSIPFGRMAEPEEIARAAVFLASENAGFVTGQTLHVNGGSYLA
jgi:NAD(P)-dependent dehydrogenase (short-subunit alcohol dehydrogenase family)